MIETRYDRAAIILGAITVVAIYFTVSFGFVGHVSSLRRHDTYAQLVILAFSVMNGVNIWWGIRWLGEGWIPPIVYALTASLASLVLIGNEYAIDWSGEEALAPFFCYVGFFIGSAAILYVAAALIGWIGKGK